MKGINYFKGKDDLVALPEEEYPEWLWRCLDEKEAKEDKGAAAGDEFGMSMLFPFPSMSFPYQHYKPCIN